MTALITDHVFRASNVGYPPEDSGRSRRVHRGRCCWLGTCDRLEPEHITPEDFRRREPADTTSDRSRP